MYNPFKSDENLQEKSHFNFMKSLYTKGIEQNHSLCYIAQQKGNNACLNIISNSHCNYSIYTAIAFVKIGVFTRNRFHKKMILLIYLQFKFLHKLNLFNKKRIDYERK